MSVKKRFVPKVYSYYDPPIHEGHSNLDEDGQPFPSMTEQSHKESSDINFILKRYERTGDLPAMIDSDPQWGDFSNVPDFQTSLEIVAKAEAQFLALDAPIRKRFDNDPSKFLAFCNDPDSGAELIKLGLAKVKPAPDASLKDVVDALKSPKAASSPSQAAVPPSDPKAR